MNPSPVTLLSFLATVAFIASLLPLGMHHAGRRRGDSPSVTRSRVQSSSLAMVLWIGLTGAVAASGFWLDFTDMPPRVISLLVPMLVVSGSLAISPWGRLLSHHLPLWSLVGFQGFRIPVEIVLHSLYQQGVIPRQMTWEGRNFDVITGVTALFLLPLLVMNRVPRGVIWIWNILGMGLLVNIVGVALLSMPTAFRTFMEEPANTLPARFPWVWLPSVLVASALVGHLLVFRALARKS